MLLASGLDPVSMILLVIGGVFALIVIFAGLFTVEQQTHVVVQRLGKFLKIAGPGLNFKVPLIDSIAGRVSHRVRELEINIESKTKDDVFVHLLVAVQFNVRETEEAVKAAHYRLVNPQQQISSYVFDTVRALVPDMPIDSVFSEKDRIAAAVKDRLSHIMEDYGFTIIQALVNDIQPDAKVKEAMNRVNASARLRDAAKNEAEGQKIRVIAEAEAEARAKELQGVGVAKQRLAIARGLKESVEACAEAGISQGEVFRMVMMTQHYDTVTAVGARSKATIMMVPYAPAGMSSVSDQIVQALMVTHEAQQLAAAPDVEHGAMASASPPKPKGPPPRATQG